MYRVFKNDVWKEMVLELMTRVTNLYATLGLANTWPKCYYFSLPSLW